jgi:medium-chain acyl-[acyl-carrier-protein] hydrolase
MLADVTDVWPIQLPGRENRIAEAAFVALRPLIRSLADAVARELPAAYSLFGHSMGALLAFELARELRRRGAAPPVLLSVAAFRAPHLPSQWPMLHLLPEPLFTKEIFVLQGTSAAVLQNVELRELLVPTLRADFAVCENYVHSGEAPLSCPIVAFGGTGDDRVRLDELEAWRKHTTGTFTLTMVPGNHFFLHSSRDALLTALRNALSRSGGRATSAGVAGIPTSPPLRPACISHERVLPLASSGR